MAFDIGQSVGNYRILQKLGSGGMGEVFLAQHPLIGKTVALKVIHQELNRNHEVLARFINEARAVSAIGNDHIVEVHDFGVSAEGAHFFIMEHLQGRTLAQAFREVPLSIEDSLHIGAQIAAGLAAAHAQNIIHRDLKPDNIMLIDKLGDPLFVKILDFGLAKMLEGGQQLTGSGVVLGTPEFMSPEAAESKQVDGRSDVYSCGVLLFQMLTGRLPFVANSMGEMMVQQVCRIPPAPRAINRAISPSVEQIVLRCLAKAPADRFQSMSLLQAALLDPEAYLRGSPPMVASDGIGAGSAQHPAMTRPAAIAHQTMSIEAPSGHKGSGRGRVLALVAIALISGAGGVGAALVQDEGAEVEGGAAKIAPAPVPSAPLPPAIDPVAEPNEPVEQARPAPLEIRVRVRSVPEGAIVTDESGERIGTTPFLWSGAADPGEVSWRFAHKGYDSMMYRFVPGDQETIQVALAGSAPPKNRRKPMTKKERGKTRVGDNVMSPNL